MNEDVKPENDLHLQTEETENTPQSTPLNRLELRRKIKRKIDELYHRGKKRVGD